eukprot:6594818-Prymnesium_polylepis.1
MPDAHAAPPRRRACWSGSRAPDLVTLSGDGYRQPLVRFRKKVRSKPTTLLRGYEECWRLWVTVSPDVTVVSDLYGGFVTPLAPSLTPRAVTRPLVGGSRGVDGGMLKERDSVARTVRVEERRASGW